jgi:hypothetical protein
MRNAVTSALLVTVVFTGEGGWSNRAIAQGQSDAKPSILVNPKSHGNGTASTIQEAIDRVSSGGQVLVLPGSYGETLTITKGLTLAAIGGESGEVAISPTGTPASVIEIATNEPVTLRGLTVHVPGLAGIQGVGQVDLTIESSSIIAPNPVAAAQSNLVTVSNDLLDGTRARLVVRDSFIDGRMTATPVGQSFLLRAQGDIDALIERNVLRGAGGACIFVVTRADLGGETNADILDNDLDECHPVGRVSAILVGPIAANQPSATRPLTATGTVNIVGNTIRNSLNFCLNSAIAYEVYSGRIEHNRITDFVQPCAVPGGRNRPSAIWIGRLSPFPFPPVTPTVRFNDLQGNAQAGLRIAPNQTVPIEASCNYWGSESGPSGVGSGSGSAVVVDPGGAVPLFMPFAVAPIAGSKTTGC